MLTQLRIEDPREYKLALRMTPKDFDDLLMILSSSFQRQDTFMRDTLPAKVKLEITLSFLASEMSFRNLKSKKITKLIKWTNPSRYLEIGNNSINKYN